MHLLLAKPGGYTDTEGVVHLVQPPGDIVILSAADTDISLLAEACQILPEDYPSVRLANLFHLRQHSAVDLYIDQVLQHARLIVVSLLGGVNYWPYGVEQITSLCLQKGIQLILVPGDDSPDEDLARRSTVSPQMAYQVWRYLREGGLANACQLFAFVGDHCFGRRSGYTDPRPLPKVALYCPEQTVATLDKWRQRWHHGSPVAALLFYRVHLQSGNIRAFDELIATLKAGGVNPLPIAVNSLKDPLTLEVVNALCEEAQVKVILNTTGFALSAAGGPIGAGNGAAARCFQADVPVLQVILSGGGEEDWRASQRGLSSSDLAMNVALPEIDGRLITRAVTFKGLARRCERTETDVVSYKLVTDRAQFVTRLARNWASLATLPNPHKRIALVLANYPTRDGRLGNGVGLDTPASVIQILRALKEAGYPVADIPTDGTALIHTLLGGVTHDPDMRDLRPCHQSLNIKDYRRLFARLPLANQQQVLERWGEPAADPMVRSGRMMIPGLRFGLIFIGIQPARGYSIDITATYHAPDLVPPHNYLAFYFWLREVYGAHAIVHVGKHGNLEWLPGKGIALSENCWPEAVFGPMPHIYPFIVNDPGEGAQAKRRAQAVIIDHLVPPLSRAESYGPLRELERLVDEYYEALDFDKRRATLLKKQIIELAVSANLHQDLAWAPLNPDDAAQEAFLRRMDAYLCELKEAQIRNGLHIFGLSPTGELRTDLLLALSRLPRGDGQGANQSLLHALCRDFGLDPAFDPLDCDMAAPWLGAKPALLQIVDPQPWRTQGDTRERLELYAHQWLSQLDANVLGKECVHTRAVLQAIKGQIAPALEACGPNELANLMHALEGRFVPPGPSGAPSRGRLEVLPTGRNFYSVDVRAIPTVTAWQLGFKSATALLERHLQEHGEYPRTLGLSVWGTATMRTGGDDIAQAFALMGVRPVWAANSNRVVDFEMLPLSVLDRPRVDVMLRISGFFRDAFSNVVKLFDAAVQAVAELDEPDELNPLHARVRQETAVLIAQGMPQEQARVRAGWRIFGSKPGAYGAGLQGLIDERCWESAADLAQAYINWGGYAYGQHDPGTPAYEVFRQRLSSLEVVLHNQDNREHDLLDSDDYYQFQGGMAVSVRALSGRQPALYHADHSQPQAPRIRSLSEEIARVIRSRVVNPKWIAGVMRHGYKGAFEMAATVDYLFAYDATTGVVTDYQYELVCDAYLLNLEVQQFLHQHNPYALKEMAERLIEAIQRGLWETPGKRLSQLEDILLETEEGLERG